MPLGKTIDGHNRYTPHLVFLLEIVFLYGGLWFLWNKGILPLDLLFLCLTATGFLLALYYGLKGAVAGLLAFALLITVITHRSLIPFLSHHSLKAGFYLGVLLITGFVRSNAERQNKGLELTNLVLNQRVEKLTVELSARDRALQEAFHQVLSDMETPRIMYQGLRRIESMGDLKSFFDEILYLLYTHCHVEKSGIYQVLDGKSFKRVTVFGASSLPGDLKWRDEEIPEILRVALAEREVIIPKEMDNRFVMAIPILSTFDKLLYIIILEEIRFINLSENLISLLKVAAFWIKSMIEGRLYRDELLTLSVFTTVVVYREDVARRILKDSISRYKRYQLPFSLLRIRGSLSEEEARGLSSSLRLYDEIFMLGENHFLVFLSMADETSAKLVLNRLSGKYPGLSMETAKEP
ncbi:MAG: hypothetical protein JRH13_06410 [Deltaproteobacteria bacterium]|nr:hypothetical protein [Deltaproteobacteria bacterium]MBW2015861.1 hypothetical protein [Deltaproteobacteria bacterium]MBW2128980.1 hypothetical protein [Deltaproteobacteria bacterium]MBW2302925.1 hypothetical protein [Deltaproteobacteria bacterium]